MSLNHHGDGTSLITAAARGSAYLDSQLRTGGRHHGTELLMSNRERQNKDVGSSRAVLSQKIS
jgi:hypothetical protein